jgi:hypothetical protein
LSLHYVACYVYRSYTNLSLHYVTCYVYRSYTNLSLHYVTCYVYRSYTNLSLHYVTCYVYRSYTNLSLLYVMTLFPMTVLLEGISQFSMKLSERDATSAATTLLTPTTEGVI